MVYAHIRGGGELGDAWHDAGKMQAKRNTFTDFIAVTEQLTARGYGNAAKVAIEGGSAGGLLLGAVVNMRPDLFRVVISHVPFVDIMNTMLDASLPLTVAEYEEWGNPNEPEAFATMLSYSPYDNLPSWPTRPSPPCWSRPASTTRRLCTGSRQSTSPASAPSRPTTPRCSSTSTWKPATAAPPAATTTSKKSPSTMPSSSPSSA
jgi:cell division septation protein DedD